MTKNEYTLKLAEIILKDWRQALLASEEHRTRASLPGDTVDISFRALQKAEELAEKFFK